MIQVVEQAGVELSRAVCEGYGVGEIALEKAYRGEVAYQAVDLLVKREAVENCKVE